MNAAQAQEKVRLYLIGKGKDYVDVENINVIAQDAKMEPHTFRTALHSLQKLRNPSFDEKFETEYRVSPGGRRFIKGIKIIRKNGAVASQKITPQEHDFTDTNLDALLAEPPKKPEVYIEDGKAVLTTNAEMPLITTYLKRKMAVEEVKSFALSKGLGEDDIAIEFTPSAMGEEAILLLDLVDKASKVLNQVIQERDKLIKNAEKEQQRSNGRSGSNT